MALEIGHRQQDGIEILDLKGRLVFGPEDLVLRNEIAALLAAGKRRFVLDLSKLVNIDTTGLGTLLFVLAKLRKCGGGLALAALRPAHMELFVIVRMETVFQIFEQDQDAINSFFPDRQVPHFDILEFLESLRSKTAPQ